MISKDLQHELREKYNPDGSQLRRAQIRMVEMLKFIDKICLKNNITYWLDFGTLLGAARHGGFIPWDDDADICMTHTDAEKFKEIMMKNNPSNEFVLQCNETDKNYYSSCWYVLRDLKSEYIQNNELHTIRKYRGVQVDIFHAEEKSFYPFFLFVNQMQRCINKLLYRHSKIPLSLIFVKILYHLLQFCIKVFRMISPNKDYFRMPYGIGAKWRIRHKKNVYPIGRIMFEGYEFNCPCNVNEYLTELYGDWEKLPDKIVTHNTEVVFYE